MFISGIECTGAERCACDECFVEHVKRAEATIKEIKQGLHVLDKMVELDKQQNALLELARSKGF